MEIIETIKSRKSVRAFLPKEVEQEKILRILEAARYSPSGTNSQPWHVAVVSGEKKKNLGQAMEAAFQELNEITTFLKVLGCYPSDDIKATEPELSES